MVLQVTLSANRAVVDRLSGYVIPLTTPFDGVREVDYDALCFNVNRTLDLPGCGGIYIGSVYQEFWTLTTAERIAITRTVADEVRGRVPVVAGVSSGSLKTTIELAEAALEAKADMLMAWPPIFGPRDSAGVLRFYEGLVQHVPLATCVYSTSLDELGFYLDESLLRELAALPPICVVKEASFNITTYLHLVETLGDRLAISTPFDEYWMLAKLALPTKTPDFLMGASRPLYMQSPGQPNFSRILELVRNNQVEDAYRILAGLSDMIQDLQMESFQSGRHPIAMVKYAASRLGMRGTTVRPPTPELTASEKKKVDEMLGRLRLVPDQVR